MKIRYLVESPQDDLILMDYTTWIFHSMKFIQNVYFEAEMRRGS